MRSLFFPILAAAVIGFAPARANETIVQEFSGSGATTTGLFKVQDRWEVRWNARQVVSVAVMSPDGTIVAGAAGVLRGSLFVPLGGRYYFKISDGTAASPSASEPAVSWHLQVVQLGTTVAASQALTVYTPFFIFPDSAVTPVPAPPPPPVLTDEQARTVVTIKGDNAQGAGFLMRSPEGTFVVTHLHLLAANPNIQIFTRSGAPVTTLALKGAIDRDLALFAIRDDHYSYLPLPADAAKGVDAGDQVIIPDIGQQTDILLGKPGRIIGMSAERIDFDNVMGPGSSGAPVIHVKSGKVLALVTAVKNVDVSDDLAKAWAANPVPGAAGIIPYFGLRLSGVRGWETYDGSRFLAETLFLRQFHLNTRSLDSYLNGKRRRARNNGDDNGPPDNRYFLNNPKLSGANDNYKQLAGDADRNQRFEAANELLSDLEGVANTDVDTLQDWTNLYAYDRVWAQQELAYRKALKKELDDLGNNIVRLDNIARSH